MDSLEGILRETLTAFGRTVLHGPWYGKEREAVSYYAFGFLAKACTQDGLLSDPAQLAIEGRIPAGPLNKKKEVCKDLVIWAVAGKNCWDADRRSAHYPIAVMEWKANSDRLFPYDLEHLTSLTQMRQGMLGIAVTFDAKKKGLLRAAKVLNGTVEENWLEVR